MTPQPLRSIVSAASLLAAATFLTGCGMSSISTGTSTGTGTGTTTSTGSAPTCTETPATRSAPTQTGPAPVASFVGGLFSGQVLAGTQPVVGAKVQLYAAGTSGNGSTPTALLTSAMTTDATGTFTDTTPYTCPYNTSVLFLVSSGGHVGSNGSNAGITLMSSPGACSTVATGSHYVLNEMTTVAGAYSFAQFLKAGGNLGATSTNTSGITLAAGTLANLVNINTGAVPTTSGAPTLGTTPASRLGTLANALNACAVSSGAATPACTGLYSAAAVGTTPTNTLDAALDIALNPGNNVGSLFSLGAASTAYTPVLAAAPKDWTLFVTYTGGGMSDPASVSIDSQGRVWVSNYFGVTSLFSNTGVPVFPTGITYPYLYESYGAAVDSSDNLWVANEQSPYGLNNGLGSITVFNSAGTPTAALTSGGLNFPLSIVFDTSKISWIVDYGNSHLTLLDSGGNPQSGTSGYTNASFQFPVAVAVDSHRNGYVANQSSNQLTKVAADGSTFAAYTCCNGASAVAVDAQDNVWTANYYGDSVSLLTPCGTVLSGSSGFAGGGILHPQGLAVDGAGKAWVANYRGPALSELASASSTQPGQILSPTSGWAPEAGLLEAFGLAIDASGNIWVSSFGSNSLTEYIGFATPVHTPLIGPVQAP